MSRYDDRFAALEQRNEGAFVPFVMLGDPNTEDSLEIIRCIVDAGVDALEAGIPFSDPIADGSTIQKSHIRALAAGATVQGCLEILAQVRSEYPDLPLGMLIYSNVAQTRGIEKFYAEFAAAGADSILLPDVPVREGAPFVAAAERANISPIFIAPAQASKETLEGVAAQSRGYIYAISRDGVTGTEKESSTLGLDQVVANVKRFGGAPILLGFGISQPDHVASAVAAGARGAITGSAITRIIEAHVDNGGDSTQPGRVKDMDALKQELTEYITSMKAATLPARR